MPFGARCEFPDFAACVAANQDKADPQGYCAALMRATEAGCRRRALVSRWRMTLKATRPFSATRVNSLARKLEPTLRRRFLRAVSRMQGAVDLEALAEALRVQQAAEALAAAHPETWEPALTPAAKVLPAAFTQSGQAAAALLTTQGIHARFDLTNPRAAQWARTQSARLITEVSESVRDSVRSVIADGFTAGTPPRESARLVRDLVGLTERQAMAVVNYRFDLLEAGRSPDDIARLGARYGRQLLNQRALTIARTETIAASTNGQQELWRQAADQGLIDPEQTKRLWIVTPDDRLCPICSPLDGETVGLEERFSGGVLVPPLHPSCRCAVGLVFE